MNQALFDTSAKCLHHVTMGRMHVVKSSQHLVRLDHFCVRRKTIVQSFNDVSWLL